MACLPQALIPLLQHGLIVSIISCECACVKRIQPKYQTQLCRLRNFLSLVPVRTGDFLLVDNDDGMIGFL